jgi:hypothetical protein
MIDSSQRCCGTYMAHIPRSFYTFDLKYYRKKSLTKTSSKNENTLNVLRIRLEKLSFIEV